jgi:hypothetical protein
MPTRLAKQLTQIFRGAVAIGLNRTQALALVLRCARDSMPQLRLEVLREVARQPDVSVNRELKSRLADLEIKIADLRLEAKVLHDDKTIESNMVVRVN